MGCSLGMTGAARFNNKPVELRDNKKPTAATTKLTVEMMMALSVSAEAAGQTAMHKRVKRATMTAVHDDGSADLCLRT